MNFKKERDRLIKLLHYAKDNSVTVRSMREFPPCFLDDCKLALIKTSEIILSDRDFILNNVFFYGKQFVEINKRFKNSPYICKECRSCKQNKNFFCRGLFNKRFVDFKNRIIKERTDNHYISIMSEYMDGVMGHGSRCNNNCFYCRGIMNSKGAVYIEPDLSLQEIQHFLHYIPKKGVQSIVFSNRCIPGEPFLCEDIYSTLSLANLFSLGSISISTNGNLLDDKLLNYLVKLGISIRVSLNTVNDEIRKKIMGYDHEMNIKEFLKKILLLKNKLSISIMPLKSNIESGDFIETIRYLKKYGLNPLINKNACYQFASEEVYSDLIYDDNYLRSILHDSGLYDDVTLLADQSEKSLNNFLMFFKDYINKFNDNTKILVIAPPVSASKIKEILYDSSNILIKEAHSSLGIIPTISSTLVIEDYLSILDHVDCDFDNVILPRASFDILLNDLNNNNINKLVSKVKGTVYML